jgi:neutral ceramidase
MKQKFCLSAVIFFLVLATTNQVIASSGLQGRSVGWKAGVAKIDVTPAESMWLAGYGGRNHPSEGTETELWVKALALEDAKGKHAVLVTIDNVGVGKEMVDNIRKKLKAGFGLTDSELIFNCSHTHSGPVLLNFYTKIYPLDAEQLKRVREYSVKFENYVVTVVGQAMRSMKPATIYAMNGITRFQVNRRNNTEASLTPLTELKGPNDYSVPVIKVVNESGNIIAVAFGYACHATCTGFYKWSGDYPGFAQMEVERSHPGAIALFFQGAGADQNPLPRSTIFLAKQYGRELASAVERVLEENMRPLSPGLSTAYSEIELPYTGLPSREELLKIADKSSSYPSWQKSWASSMIEKTDKKEKIETGYPCYPCQVWKLGDQAIMTMGGELVIEYAIKLKQIFGQDIFVLGYTNDVMSYIPSVTILKEGGYEGIRSQLSTGLPGTYKPEIESIIINKVTELAVQAGVPKPINK